MWLVSTMLIRFIRLILSLKYSAEQADGEDFHSPLDATGGHCLQGVYRRAGSAWMLAQRTPLEYRHKVDAATRCWHDMTWHDMTWHDMTWHDMTWHDMTWHNAHYFIIVDLRRLCMDQRDQSGNNVNSFTAIIIIIVVTVIVVIVQTPSSESLSSLLLLVLLSLSSSWLSSSSLCFLTALFPE